MEYSSVEAEMGGYKPRYIKNRSSHHLKNAVPLNRSGQQRNTTERGEFPLLNRENMSRSLDGERMIPIFFHNINYGENQDGKRGRLSSVGNVNTWRTEQLSTPTSHELEDDSTDASGSFKAKFESDAKTKDKQNQIFYSEVKELGRTVYPPRMKSSVEKNPTGSHPCEILDHDPEDMHRYPIRYSYKPQNILAHGERREDINETQSFGYSPSENSHHLRTNSIREHQDVRVGRDTESMGSDEYQMPDWAKQMLSKKLFLTCRFRNIRKSIEKWSFQTRAQTQPTLAGIQPPVVFTVDGNSLTSTSSSSADGYHPDDIKHNQRQKTDNIAVCVLGLFLIVVFVIPVVVVIYIYTDRSEYVSTELKMTFNGTLQQITNENSVAYNICRQIDLALSAFHSFHGCDVNSSIGGLTETDLTVFFKSEHFPMNKTVTGVVNSHFTALKTVGNYSYVYNSTIVRKYDFVNILGINIYLRQGT